jgi:MoaA/NifB/PqqE/SkfB family radical SAM enzyme
VRERANRARLHTGFACNNRCIFCAQENIRQREETLTGDGLRAAIDDAVDAGATAVDLVGGEPTLLDGLEGLIRHACSTGVESVLLQTNGRRLSYRAYARQLVESGLDAAEISIHGPREKIHDYHTRVPGSFGQTLRGIANARAAGLKVGTTMVVTRSNFRHLDEQVELMSKMGVDAVHFAVARSFGAALERFRRVVPRWSAMVPALKRAADRARRLGIPLLINGLPICLLADVGVVALDDRIPGAFPPGIHPGESCGRCARRNVCPGVDVRYLERFGPGELIPREASPSAGPTRRDPESPGSASLFAGTGIVE